MLPAGAFTFMIRRGSWEDILLCLAQGKILAQSRRHGSGCTLVVLLLALALTAPRRPSQRWAVDSKRILRCFVSSRLLDVQQTHMCRMAGAGA
jgi:hypothetical protein